MNKKTWSTTKKNFKMLVPILIYVAAIIITIRLLPNQNLLTIVLVIVTASIIGQLITRVNKKKQYPLKEIFKGIFKTGLFVTIIYSAFMFLGGYGWIGLVVAVLGYSAFVLIRRRKVYMAAVRSVEEQVFGETLDKEVKKK